jgi:hypothetical protein
MLLGMALLLVVMTAPLFVVVAVALYGAYVYPRYVEAPIAIFLFDSIYGGGVFVASANVGIMFPLTFYALIVFAFAEFLRSKVREGAMTT